MSFECLPVGPAVLTDSQKLFITEVINEHFICRIFADILPTSLLASLMKWIHGVPDSLLPHFRRAHCGQVLKGNRAGVAWGGRWSLGESGVSRPEFRKLLTMCIWVA